MTWTPCYWTPHEIQAYVVKGYLEQYGVPCLVESTRFGMKPLTFCALGEVRLLVREDWLLIAQGLLRGRDARPARHLRLVRRGDA
jgi:hypothetical protein